MDLETGAPKDELAPDTLSWFKTLGVEYKKLSEVIAAGPCPKVNLHFKITNHFQTININSSNRFQYVFFQCQSPILSNLILGICGNR